MYTNRELGAIGERIAERWLVQNDYYVIEKNFYAKGSEIDIIATKEDSIHFIEVKTVIHETFKNRQNVIHETKKDPKNTNLKAKSGKIDVIHETKGFYRPEDKVDVFKLRRMKWGIRQYLYLKDIKDMPIFIDVIAIVLYKKEGNWIADVKCIDNVIIE